MIETTVFCDRCKHEIYQPRGRFNILTSHDNEASNFDLCPECSICFLEWMGWIRRTKVME